MHTFYDLSTICLYLVFMTIDCSQYDVLCSIEQADYNSIYSPYIPLCVPLSIMTHFANVNTHPTGQEREREKQNKNSENKLKRQTKPNIYCWYQSTETSMVKRLQPDLETKTTTKNMENISMS